MASSGDSITRQSIYDEFIARVLTTAANTIVFNSASNPGATRINVGQLGPASFTPPAGGVTPIENNVNVTASTIMSVTKAYAAQSTVARRARSGLIVDNFDPDTAETTTNDRTDVCRLADSYIVTYNYDPSLSGIISAPNLHTYLNTLRSIASSAQSSASVVDLRVCHSSCHTSCHGSRGRR